MLSMTKFKFFFFIFVPWPISVTQQELNKFVLNKWRRKCVWDTEVIKIIEAKSRNKIKKKTGKENLKNNVRLCEEIQKRVKPLKPKVFTCERKERKKKITVTSFPGVLTTFNNVFVRMSKLMLRLWVKEK